MPALELRSSIARPVAPPTLHPEPGEAGPPLGCALPPPEPGGASTAPVVPEAPVPLEPPVPGDKPSSELASDAMAAPASCPVEELGLVASNASGPPSGGAPSGGAAPASLVSPASLNSR